MADATTETIKITIRQSSGDQSEVEISPTATVLDLKNKCAESLSIPAES